MGSWRFSLTPRLAVLTISPASASASACRPAAGGLARSRAGCQATSARGSGQSASSSLTGNCMDHTVSCMQNADQRRDDPALESLRPPETLERQTYDALRRALKDRFAPGQRLNASAVARQLGVSRMPVVQAFQRLIGEGFLTADPYKGVWVAKPTPEAIRERYLTLIALESLCATEAIRIAPDELARQMRSHHHLTFDIESDRDFHEVLWRLSNFPHVAAHLALLWEQGTYYRTLLFQDSKYLRHQRAEHGAMVAAAESGDRDQVVAALTAHRMAGLERMLEVMQDQQAQREQDWPESHELRTGSAR
jgi:DNA-binding GntR family transcriptional regulator